MRWERTERLHRLFAPLVRNLDRILPAFLGSMRDVPSHPVEAGRLALRGLTSARHLARRFRTEEGRALVAGTAAHSMLPLTAPLSGVFPLLFTALAQRYGWPVVEGGSAAIVDALVAELAAAGGRLETNCLVKRLDELPPARTVVLDVTPRQLLEMAGDSLPSRSGRGSPATAMGLACARSTGRSRGRCPGVPRAAGRPPPCTWAGHSRKLHAVRRTSTPAGIRIAPIAWSPNPAWWIPGGRPSRHTLWAYAMCPTAHRWT